MKPRPHRETGQTDLFRPRLDRIINPADEVIRLGRLIDWGFIEANCGEAYSDAPGQPPLPTRLMAGLSILKHTFGLSDEALCARFLDSPHFQYFCGEEFFRHDLPAGRSSLTRATSGEVDTGSPPGRRANLNRAGMRGRKTGSHRCSHACSASAWAKSGSMRFSKRALLWR